MRRVASVEGHLSSVVNKNVNWVGTRFYVFYISFLVVGAYLMHFLLADRVIAESTGWTLVHVVHGVITFLTMHWVTGAPSDLGDNCDYFGLSWWEQLEDGIPWTATKKNLMVIPVVLFLITSHLTQYNLVHLSVNLLVLCMALIPKLPQLERLRLGSEHDKQDNDKLE